jgi:hypothetical protein
MSSRRRRVPPVALTCTGKFKHPTQAQAEAEIARMVSARRVATGELLAYLCPHCEYWHLGHPKGWYAAGGPA